MQHNPQRDIISSADVSVISLKSVWSALLRCSSSVVDWSTSHTDSTTTSGASSHVKFSNQINRKYDELQVDDVMDVSSPNDDISIPVIVKDLISRLVCCLHDISADSNNNTQKGPYGALDIFQSQSGLIALFRNNSMSSPPLTFTVSIKYY